MSTPSARHISGLISVALAFAGGTAIALHADLSAAAESGLRAVVTDDKIKSEPEATEIAQRDFPTNRSGLTYGSDVAAQDPREGPDLVAVVGDLGIRGYVTNADLNGPVFTSPEEALKWQESNVRRASIPVYDVEGENVIDTFTFAPTRSSDQPSE